MRSPPRKDSGAGITMKVRNDTGLVLSLCPIRH